MLFICFRSESTIRLELIDSEIGYLTFLPWFRCDQRVMIARFYISSNRIFDTAEVRAGSSVKPLALHEIQDGGRSLLYA